MWTASATGRPDGSPQRGAMERGWSHRCRCTRRFCRPRQMCRPLLATDTARRQAFAHAERNCKSCSRKGAATAMQCRAEHVHRAAAGPIPEVPGRRAPLTPLYKHPCSPVRVRGPIFRLPLQPHLRRCRREAICLSSSRARRLRGAGSCPFRPPQACLRPETALLRSSPSGQPSTTGRPGSSA